MTIATYDIEGSLRQAMSNAGIVTNDPIIADGELHRIHVNDDRQRDKNGWYVIYSDAIPAGAYGCWKRDISETWCAKETSKLSSQERETFTRRMEAAKAEREQERKRVHAEAQARAQKIWGAAKPAPESHPYLTKKKIGAHGLRVAVQGKYKDSLVVPLRDAAGVIHSLQYIAEDGTKRFLTGGRVSGCYFAIGKPRGKIYIVEGFATGATVREVNGEAVAVAFDKGNLGAVAKSLRGKFPDARIIIAGDNDHQTEGNPGKTKALEAAGAVGGLVALPVFQDGQTGTDFNDLFMAEGQQAVKRQLEAAAPPPLSDDPQAEPITVQKSFPTTESGQAEYFAHLYGDQLRYDHQRETWLIFKKHWWQPDQDGEVYRLAKQAARKRYMEAWKINDQKEKSKEADFAIKCESRSKIDATLALAKNEGAIADPGTGWDVDPWLLSVANGVIDLRTGELRPGKPDDRITKHSPVKYDPKARSDQWEKFVREVFDLEIIDFIWQAAGYSLTGLTSEQCLFLCHGTGANGKTTFLNILRYVLGGYGWNTGFSTLEKSYYKTSSEDIAGLEGRRLVTASETGEAKRLNEARVKALTGGDAVTARHLYQSERMFTPTCKIWLSTNHLPLIRDDSYGFWRRVRLIPFTRRFIGQAEDRNLETTLKQEATGILTWAVLGAVAWQENGLEIPEMVSKATAEYREDSNPLAEFLAEYCILENGQEIKAAEFYKAYKAWAEENGLSKREAMNSTQFGRLMGGQFEKKKTRNGAYYFGVGLK